MIVKLLPLLLLTLKTSRCSLVFDQAQQQGIHLSDYCPNMKYCREGAHTMCMYYDPKNVIGPRCFNYHNVTMTAALATRVLDVSNIIRSKVAKGIETGQGGVLLPRGYGMFRLKWDSELATIAQVLANQCILRHDLCRATKKFPSPSQTIGLVRFQFPDWAPMSSSSKLKNIKGLSREKIVYSITQSMKNWYDNKFRVTADMVKVYPDFSVSPYTMPGKLYLDMIHGPATHMGCAMSGYAEYVHYEHSRQGIHNCVTLVCNFSSGARKGTPTYEIEPPIPGQGFSAKCGCPPGSVEDADCLCNEVESQAPVPRTCPLGETSSYCDPALILLPIFTIEDAPPEKLYQFAEEMKDPLKNYILQRVDNTTDAPDVENSAKPVAPTRTSNDMFDIFNENGAENSLGTSEIPDPSLNNLFREQESSPQFHSVPDSKPPPLPPPPLHWSPALRPSHPARLHPHTRPAPPPPPPPRIPPSPPPSPPPPPRVEQYSTALQTHDNPRLAKPASSAKKRRPPPKLPPKHHQVKKKASIFTRVPQFILPKKRIATPFKVFKKDVKPRKDFSNVIQVVNDYLKHHSRYRIVSGNIEQTQPMKDIKPHEKEKAQTEAVASETSLNRVEENVINFDQYLGQKNSSNYNDKNIDIKDDNDNKLLSLLDTLEREVKHIALDGNEKQVIDAKIRKIYGSIVGRTAVQKFPKPILFSTPDPEAPEIDFGETKSGEKLEPNPRIEKNHLEILTEPKQKSRFEVDQRIELPSSSVQGHKWKNELIDSFDQKKHKPDISNNEDRKPSDRYNYKYNENHSENTYGDIQHERMNELDHKYNENLKKKYNENHLDHEYNEAPHKFNEKFDHSHHYDADDEPAARSKMKYPPDRTVFREFEHTPRNYRNTIDNKGLPDIPLINKDRDKRQRSEKKHRKRIKSLGSRNDNDILSLERRKYYQEKLDSIKRKLRARRNGRNNDSKKERSLRRMHVINREATRMRSKDQADNFYMPERARFLHGF